MLYCPRCGAERVTVVAVADDYRSVKIKCAACLKESRLAFPPIRTHGTD
jgi:transcription elongation factor Elf1